MRPVFGKYAALFTIIGVIIQAVVIVTFLLETFRATNALARILFDTFTGGAVALNVFGFIADWAGVLSVFAVCLVLLAFFINFREYRRSRALRRIHGWARNMVLALAYYRQRDPSLQESPQERYEEIRALIDEVKANRHIALADARILGGKLDVNLKEAVSTLLAIDEKLGKQDDSAFEDLRILQNNLSDVMIAAFELMPH